MPSPGPPAAFAGGPRATWTRPVPDRDADFVKPARVPSQPVWQPARREEDRPLYSPPPEFRPSELPDKTKEMPAGPRMPERRPDPIPAGESKERLLGFCAYGESWHTKALALTERGYDQGVGSARPSILTGQVSIIIHPIIGNNAEIWTLYRNGCAVPCIVRDLVSVSSSTPILQATPKRSPARGSRTSARHRHLPARREPPHQRSSSRCIGSIGCGLAWASHWHLV